MNGHDDVMIRGLGSLGAEQPQLAVKMAVANVGAPTANGGFVIGGVVPTAQQPVQYFDGLSQFAQENPLLSGGLILGGAYMAYKAGSLLGGLLAGGAALLYGSHILAGLSGDPAPKQIVMENDFLIGDGVHRAEPAPENDKPVDWTTLIDNVVG